MAAGTQLSATLAGLRELLLHGLALLRGHGRLRPPLADEIHVLRALRDRQLQNHVLGRALVRAYYAIGPSLAAPVAEHGWLARGVRFLLSPVVRFARWLQED